MIMCLKKMIFGMICGVFAFYSCSASSDFEEPTREKEKEKGKEAVVLDTIEYRALVYIDEPSLARYGGEQEFNKNLKTMFHHTTLFWNESENKFKYYFRFVPVDLRIYPHVDGENYDKYSNEAGQALDLKYDYVVFFCLAAPSNTMACGGSSDGHSVIWCTKTLETQKKDGDIFHDGEYPVKLGTYSNLGHEAGHFRGATDLYQYAIKAANNPVSGVEFKADPCNMGTGTWVWSDYASAVFNYTAKYKRLPSDWGQRRFPNSIEIKVTKDGKPLQDAAVKLYGCRGGGGDKKLPSGDNGPDVYEVPFRTFKTNVAGKVKIDDAYHLYQVRTDGSEILPDPLPWAYWFSFLVEVVDKEANRKTYRWMTDLEIQRQHLEENNEVYHMDIDFK